MATISQEQLDSLTAPEKLALIEFLWNSLEPDDIPLHDWQKRELEQALEEYRLNPEEGEDWEDVRARIEKSFS